MAGCSAFLLFCRRVSASAHGDRRGRIDDRGPGDAGTGNEVATVVEVHARQGGTHVRVPQHRQLRARVERVDAVRLGHDEDDVVHLAADGEPGNEERLCVHVAVDGLRELLEKEFLYRSPYDGTFFINIRYMFNGDRLAFVKAYHLKGGAKPQPEQLSLLPE